MGIESQLVAAGRRRTGHDFDLKVSFPKRFLQVILTASRTRTRVSIKKRHSDRDKSYSEVSILKMQGNRPPGPARGRPVSSTPQPTYSLEDDLALTPTPSSEPEQSQERKGVENSSSTDRPTTSSASKKQKKKKKCQGAKVTGEEPPASFAGRRSPRSGTRTATWSKSTTSTKKTLGSSLTWRSVKKEPAPAPSVQNTSPICPAMSPHARRRSGRRERKKRGKARERAMARAHPTLVHKTTKNTIKCSKKTKKSKKI